MLDQTTRQTILTLRDAGNGIRAIARALGISRVAVKRVLASGEASPGESSGTARSPAGTDTAATAGSEPTSTGRARSWSRRRAATGLDAGTEHARMVSLKASASWLVACSDYWPSCSP